MTKQVTSDDEIRHHIIEINKEASKPILNELSQAGFDVEWVSDLYNKHLNYRQVIPILLKWLLRVENKDVKVSIVRALSVPWARKTSAPRLLVNEFRRQFSDPNLQWVIGNALSVVADDELLNEIVELIRDPKNGKAREMLVISLGNMKKPEVEKILIELLEDEDLAGYAIMVLGKKKSKKARPIIERYHSHSKRWVRRE